MGAFSDSSLAMALIFYVVIQAPKDLEEIIENYSEFPKVSFDYEVVEKADRSQSFHVRENGRI